MLVLSLVWFPSFVAAVLQCVMHISQEDVEEGQVLYVEDLEKNRCNSIATEPVYLQSSNCGGPTNQPAFLAMPSDPDQPVGQSECLPVPLLPAA